MELIEWEGELATLARLEKKLAAFDGRVSVSKLNEYLRSLEEAIQPSPVILTYEIHIDRKTDGLAYINGFSDMTTLPIQQEAIIIPTACSFAV